MRAPALTPAAIVKRTKTGRFSFALRRMAAQQLKHVLTEQAQEPRAEYIWMDAGVVEATRVLFAAELLLKLRGLVVVQERTTFSLMPSQAVAFLSILLNFPNHLLELRALLTQQLS